MIYVRLAIAAGLVAFFAFTHYLAHQYGADGVRLETSKQALKQIERAQDETRSMQEKLDGAQQTYQKAQADIGLLGNRIRILNDRMLNTPSTEQLANLTAATLSAYASDTDRDFAECRDRYAALGRTAASASAAAWAHRDAWPTIGPKRPTPPTQPTQPTQP
jgi:hypothetical protein